MIERFVSRRKEEWTRLDALVKLARQKRVGALSAEQIVALGYLYRRAAGDLAIARRDFPGDRLTLYLNQLVARAHAVVYRPEAGEWRQFVAFFRRGFPALYRETLPFTAAAFLIFALAGLAGFVVVLRWPDSAPYLVPQQIVATVQEQRMWTEEMPVAPPLMSSAIMANNIQVALFALAGGVLFGIATFYVLAMNGLQIGAVAGLCQSYGLSLRLWSFIAPHGFIELSVIFIAGGGGLRLGYALLQPGLHSRREALSLAARRVVKLLFGCVPLLVVAGVIEGFVSPSALPPTAKLLIGAATGLALYAYLLGAGRKPVTAASAPSAPGTY